jgi:anti-sigma B factor antagonist
MLHVSSHEMNGHVVVELFGRLDGSPSCRTLCQVVKGCLDEGHRQFVVDLENVEWMSSCGIGCLISTYTSIRRDGGTLALRSPNDRVLAALEITELVPAVFEVIEADARAVGH